MPEPDDDPPDLPFIAYEHVARTDGLLAPAPPRRAWMDATPDRYAYRCLPLVIANQAGWLVLGLADFQATWNGGPGTADITFAAAAGDGPRRLVETWVSSHFGAGILTFQIPYLFRTPPGHNLWVRGPINDPRDGIAPLDALIEADWSDATFTMNWKFTRPGVPVVFRAGEPVCQVFPYPRGLLERLDPQVRPLAADPDLAARHAHWQHNRRRFLADLPDPATRAHAAGWQKDYFRGLDPDGRRRPDHQTRLDLREFRRPDDPPAACD